MRQKHHSWIKTDPKMLAEKHQSPEHQGSQTRGGKDFWVRRREGSSSGDSSERACSRGASSRSADEAASDYGNNLIKRNCFLGHGGWEENQTNHN